MEKIFKPGKNKAFTLLEIIVVLDVVISIITSALTLITMTVSTTSAAKSRIIAIGLSQEGLEIVRNIRDNNWLSGRRGQTNWRFGLTPGDYLVQYNSGDLMSFASRSLMFNNGYYQYDGGTNTPFYRKITIEYMDDNQIKVVSEITWNERGRSQIISAELRLYNWLKQS